MKLNCRDCFPINDSLRATQAGGVCVLSTHWDEDVSSVVRLIRPVITHRFFLRPCLPLDPDDPSALDAAFVMGGGLTVDLQREGQSAKDQCQSHQPERCNQGTRTKAIESRVSLSFRPTTTAFISGCTDLSRIFAWFAVKSIHLWFS